MEWAARQPDTEMLRTLELAGAAHADQAAVDYVLESTGVWYDGPPFSIEELCGTVNDGPLQEEMRAGLAAFDAWIGDGGVPPNAPLITMDDAGLIVRDELGNAEGGVRSPAVDAPTMTLSGREIRSCAAAQFTPSRTGRTSAIWSHVRPMRRARATNRNRASLSSS
jgi:hypothetical protein